MYYMRQRKMDEPTYEVEKHLKLKKTTGPDIYETKPILKQDYDDLTEEQTDLWLEVRLYGDLPDDAEEGEVYTASELLPDDHQISAERDQEALGEAVETGEEVVISSASIGCNDDDKKCSLDRVARVATPEGNIEKRRTHTY
jgi:hypothetical protein